MMKKDQIKIGQVYAAKVTGKVVPVQIDAENPNGGWDATNIHTNRPVRIKSAQRLRNRVSVPGADDEPKVADASRKSATRAKKPAKATKDAKPAPQRDTGERAATGGQREANDAKPMSLLDAAAHLLSLGTGDPMRCKDIVDLAVARGLWTPGNGRTPANTLYASILREIKTKGDASRFVKAERGKFGLQR
jgi:hypothetical protein